MRLFAGQAWFLVAAAIVGCSQPLATTERLAGAGDLPPGLATSGTGDSRGELVSTTTGERRGAGRDLRGAVDYSPVKGGRPALHVQATMTDIAVASTVSLIDTTSNTTVATTLTDASGSFLLAFPPSFEPAADRIYLLEAIKGLGNNAPTRDAARVRTVVRFASGWLSIANSATGSPVPIGAPTTALAAGAQLRNQAAADTVSLVSLIGSYDVDSTTYTPVAGLSQGDFGTILNIVNGALAQDADPVALVGLQGSTWVLLNGGRLTVTGISPNNGPAGTSVTISGFDIPPSSAALEVTFGGVSGTITAASSISITVTAPTGMSTGQVVVYGSGQAVTAGTFTVPLDVTGLAPTSGPVGTSMGVYGAGFAPAASDSLAFDGVSAHIIEVGATKLSGLVPEMPAGTHSVAVTVPGQAATVSATFTVLPYVASPSKLAGAAGTSLIVTGTGFDPVSARDQVTFAGTSGTVTAASAGSLTVTIPNITATDSVAVTVTVNGQSTAAPPISIQPLVSSLSPGSVAVGGDLSLTGTGFATATASDQVAFTGGIAGAAKSASLTGLTVTIPPGAISGPVSVSVNGLPGVFAGNLTVPVSIASVSPSSASPGTTITLTGSGFATEPGLDTVVFGGGATASVIAATATSLKVVVPQAATTGAIGVKVAGQNANSGTFAVNSMSGIVLQ